MIKNTAKKLYEKGRSMIEMLGVLAIIGVLSVGGLSGYTMAMNRHRANAILDYATRTAVAFRTLPISEKINHPEKGLDCKAYNSNEPLPSGTTGCHLYVYTGWGVDQVSVELNIENPKVEKALIDRLGTTVCHNSAKEGTTLEFFCSECPCPAIQAR